MRKLILVSIYLLLTIATVGIVKAQENPEEIARKYGISFPISELGNCTNYSECRNYCEDPVNYNACIDFAKKKGFYEEEKHKPDEKILAQAKQVLGCTSYESCRNFCEQKINFDKCNNFAQSVDVAGGYREDPRSSEFIAKAKEVLGCDSYESCRNFCDNIANRDKCAEFATKIGISGGYEYRGPGGCTTEETCKTFCSLPENVEICKQYSQASGREFTGPGGCTDETSCRAYCEKNPSACGSMQTIQPNPSEYCSRTPGCSWDGTSCKCTNQTNYPDPALECQKNGCSWNGSYCQCSSLENYQEKLKSECTSYPGCSWTGTSCQCSQESTGSSSYTQPSDPAAECSRYPGCSWNGTTCQCQSVQGAKTPINFLQKILLLLGQE